MKLLTDEQIDSLPAGPELDAMLAEGMGWQRLRTIDAQNKPPMVFGVKRSGVIIGILKSDSVHSYYSYSSWYPSEDSPAGLVASERLIVWAGEQGYEAQELYRLGVPVDVAYECILWPNEYMARAATRPLARSRATAKLIMRIEREKDDATTTD